MGDANADIVSLAVGIIPSLATPAFSSAMDSALHRLSEFDLTAVIGFPMGQKPLLLHDGLKGISPPNVMRNYLNATYVLDACYVACTQNIGDGLYRLSDVAPDQFFASGYYNSPDVHPCISLESGALAEEIFYVCQARPGYFICYSLMRSSGLPPFSAADMEALRAAAPLVNSLVARQWGSEASGARQVEANPDRLESAFTSFETTLLSPREQHIVSMVLRGHSSLSIGNRLGIAEGTVKNHRKSIYAKLGISSQGELFARFVNHALGRA